MIVYDLLKECDIKEVADIWVRSYWERKYSHAEAEDRLRMFLHTLEEITPEPSDCVFLALPSILEDNDGGEYRCVYANYIENEELAEKIIKLAECDIPPFPRSMAECRSRETYREVAELFPESYCFEYELWEEVLGAEVFPENYEYVGKQWFIADLLWEFSFNGFTREEQEKRWAELEESIKEVEEMRSGAWEEEDTYFHEWDPADDRTDEEMTGQDRYLEYLNARILVLMAEELKRFGKLMIHDILAN